MRCKLLRGGFIGISLGLLLVAVQAFAQTGWLPLGSWVLGVGLGTPASVDLNFTNNLYYQDGIGTGNSVASYVTTSRASPGTAVDSFGNWTTFSNNVARVTNLGLLVEESRTNIQTQSSALGNAVWSESSSGVVAPTITTGQAAPDGTTNAAKLVYPAVSTAINFSLFGPASAPTQASTSTYTGSVFLKGNVGGEQIYLSATPNGVTYARLRVTLTTSWQMFQLPWTTAAASYFFTVGTDLRDASQTSTSAQTIFIWNPQTELGSFATSPIPTTSAAVTRVADVVTLTTVPTFGRAYTLYASGTPQAPASYTTSQQLLVANDGTANNRIITARNPSTGIFQVNSVASGSANTAVGATVWAQNTPQKAAGAFGGGSQRSVINGGAVASGSATIPSGLNTVWVGNRGDGATQFWNGTISRVALWPTVALSSGTLQTLTGGGGAANDNGTRFAENDNQIVAHDVLKRALWR